MQVLPDNRTVYFDVDETLIMWSRDTHFRPYSPEEIRVGDYSGIPHRMHIDIVKRHHRRGSVVVVWSNNGSTWAEKVVRALGLQDYVTLIITKPDTYFDDMDASAFMGKRAYVTDSNSRLDVPATSAEADPRST